jgi:hypothetical protein
MSKAILLPFVTTFDDKGIRQGQSKMGGLAVASLASAVSVGKVVQELGKAVKAAAEDQKQQDLLALAVRNNTSATDDQIVAMEKTIAKMEMQKAVADDELRPALGMLVRATGDLTQSQKLLNLALDISAGTGKDLQTITMALSKAQTGQIGALTRLGIPLDAAAVKSKDLGAIQRDLANRFKGASDAAANSAEGGMKKLQIAMDNMYEVVGYALLPTVSDYVVVLGELARITLSSEAKTNKWTDRFVTLVKILQPAIKGVETINRLVRHYSNEIQENNKNQKDYVDQIMRTRQNIGELTKVTDKDTDSTKKSADAKKKAKAAAKEYADTLRERVKTAVETVTSKVEEAQAAFDGYRDSIANAITGSVSLADAFRSQEAAEANLQDALKDRANAYAALNRLDPTGEAEAYADALDRVAQSESKVASATDARSSQNYISIFKQQIADAKAFAANLETLVGLGLNKTGLAQLINLGPIAGKSVTDDLINGRKGLNVAELNQSLNELTSAGQSVGVTGANAFFGGALSGAQGAQGQVANYQITVNAGLVSNPAQVGRDIIEAIKSAERVSGQVFVSV